jgi:hypothetical protein
MLITFRNYPIKLLLFTIDSDEFYAISVGTSFICCLLGLFAINNLKNPIIQRTVEKFYHILCMYILMTMDIMFAVAILCATVVYSICFHYNYQEIKVVNTTPRFYAEVPHDDSHDVIVESAEMRM